ncbi:ComEC/Rec2 family competence protein [Balneola sp. MJW-20]|uniref:ComEC/Rec2 family competence protein n=1 Tax=Gracilimonas aurantiaca TaxID=3234185 RepID=UPI003464F9D2
MKHICTILLLTLYTTGYAQDLKVKVADVGAGLCTIIEIPNPSDGTDPFYMLYDVGAGCRDDIQQMIPSDQPIDLMVLSHNDSDHISNADEILEVYEVRKILWSGFERPGIFTYEVVNEAISAEEDAEVINLGSTSLPIGSTWIFGDTYVTFVAGFNVPPESWGFSPSDASEYRNAGSIVMRVVHKGSSLLLVGDMIGRLENDASFPEDSVVAAEAYVINNSGAVPIDSDILVASHHGGNDGSSVPFIQAVRPEYVIFPSGSRDTYGHPRATVAQRFLDFGVDINKIFRTDREDDETHPGHWEPNGDTGVNDRSGDDSVIITISEVGVISVRYEN